MPLGKMNFFKNQQTLLQQNQSFQPLIDPRQFNGSNYTPLLGRGLQKFLPMMGRQGSLPLPPGLTRRFGGFQSQNFGQQPPPPQYPLAPTQGYPQQTYAPQKPVQPAWEQPSKGGIKGFISNFMAKRKK